MTYQLRSNTITFEAALRDVRSSKHDRTRAQAAHALGDVTSPEDRARAVPALVAALTDGHPVVRTEAALALGELGSEDALEPLAERIDDPTPVVRQSALIALGRLGNGKSFAAVAQALREGPPDVRFQAATSLVEIDPERARPALLPALDDDSGEVVSAVAMALSAIGEVSARDRIAELLDEWTPPKTRPEAHFDIAYALAYLGDARALDVLGGFVDDKARAWDAISALEQLALGPAPESSPAGGDGRAPAPDRDPLADDLCQSAAVYIAPAVMRRFFDPMIKIRAAAAVLALDPDNAAAESAKRVLLTGLRSRKRDQRGLAIEQLGRVGGEWAIEPLRALRARRAGKPFLEEIDDALAQLPTP